jgi:hypothetical protein
MREKKQREREREREMKKKREREKERKREREKERKKQRERERETKVAPSSQTCGSPACLQVTALISMVTECTQKLRNSKIISNLKFSLCFLC